MGRAANEKILPGLRQLRKRLVEKMEIHHFILFGIGSTATMLTSDVDLILVSERSIGTELRHVCCVVEEGISLGVLLPISLSGQSVSPLE